MTLSQRYRLYFKLEIQSTDQRKFREKPAIESVVPSVMERIVSTVEMGENRNIANVENSGKVVKKATNRRGQEKRRQYTASFKAEVIGEYKSGMKDDDVAMLYRINQSLVCSENILLFSLKYFFLRHFLILRQFDRLFRS